MIIRSGCTILFLSAFIVFFPISLDGEEIPSTGNFRWVLGRILPDDSFERVTEYILINEQQENELLLYFLPISNAYLYLFTLSTRQEFRLLFPDTSGIFNTSTYYYKSYEFHKAQILPIDALCPGHRSQYNNRDPDSKSWIEICMLVSTRRLKEFERLIRTYRSASGSRKIMVFADILMELTHLKNQRYLADVPVIPWDAVSFTSHGETSQGMQIELTAQEFNHYFMAVFRYECE